MDECGERSFMETYEKYQNRHLYGLADIVAAEELGVLRLRRDLHNHWKRPQQSPNPFPETSADTEHERS